jgi:hypothetical protein
MYWHYRIIRSTTSGQSTEYILPGEPSEYGIATGPDGRIWVTDGGSIARVNPYLYTGPSPTPARSHAPQLGTTIEYGAPVYGGSCAEAPPAGSVEMTGALSKGSLALGGHGSTGIGLAGTISCASLNTMTSQPEIDATGLSFNSSSWRMASALPYEWTLEPVGTATGTLEAHKNSAGEVEDYRADLTLSVALALSYGGYSCTIGPITATLTTGKSGTAEGSPLKPSGSGALEGELVAKDFPVPELEAPKFGESEFLNELSRCPPALARLIGDDAALPASPGQAEMRFHVSLAPETLVPHARLLPSGALPAMDENAVSTWGQKDIPVEATAVIPPVEPQSWPAATYKAATVYYLDEPGRVVNVAAPSNGRFGAISTTEYNEWGDVVRTLSPQNRIRALEAGRESAAVARLLSTESTYDGEGGQKENEENEAAATEPGSELVETVGPQHMVRLQHPPKGEVKAEVPARERTKYYYNREEHVSGTEVTLTGPPNTGETYHLLTETQTFADLEGPVSENPQLEVRTTKYSYRGQENLGWKLRKPTSVTVDPTMTYTEDAHNIEHETVYEPNTGQVVETRGPGGLGGDSPHDQRTVYYSAGANTEHAECGEHREWAGLVCLAYPVRQPKPEAVSAPGLPEVKTLAYNIYDQPETVEEVLKTSEASGEVKTSTRTKTIEYDSAGRAKTTRITSSAPESEAKKLPTVTYGYDPQTGAQISESAGGITTESIFNTLGQLVEYKDGTGNVAHYSYEKASGLLKEVEDSTPVGGPGAYQRYFYNQTTGALIRLEDSQAGTFTASYDGSGQLVSERYPNGLCANYSYNQIEEATHLEYTKEAGCAPAGAANPWFSETLYRSVHGEALEDVNSFGSTQYSYDEAGRLEALKETLRGKCTVELFVYDQESNRISQTKRAPAEAGVCPENGGEVQAHRYSEGNRLTDEGVQYNSLGYITAMPAADAGGHVLESEFYLDGQVASQSQVGRINSYVYGPSGRLVESSTESLSTAKSSRISQYDGPGQVAAWTCEGTSGKCEGASFTRNIPGIDGALSAVDENGKVTLQLHDLKGDVVETAEDSASATRPLSEQPASTFGVPVEGSGATQKFSFLGASGISSELPSSGVIVQGGTSYVPQTAITLQAEGAPPPGLPEGSGPMVAYALQVDPWGIAGAIRSGDEAPGRAAAREREAAAQAEAECEASEGESVTCGSDPEHGFNIYGCRVWASWGHTFLSDEEITAHGHYSCKHLPVKGFELEVWLEEVVPGVYGETFNIIEDAHHWWGPKHVELSANWSDEFPCFEGTVYRLRVWGYYPVDLAGLRWSWTGERYDARVSTCKGPPPQDSGGSQS